MHATRRPAKGVVPKVIKIRSDSTPGLWYKTSRDRDGNLSCECNDFRYRAKDLGARCKHLSRAIQQGLLSQ